jgi:hypothetical protein
MRKLTCLLALLFAGPALSATITATSCALADVSAAMGSAADGDTISVPAGSCTWNATLTVSKGVSIVGRGNGTTTADTQLVGGRFTITTPNGKSVRVSGVRLSGTTGFNIIGATKSFRIDHVYFSQPQGATEDRVIWIECAASDYCAGVIDHNTFDQSRGSINIHIREQAGAGNNSWNRPLDLGGPDAIYIEDNTFTRPANTYDIEGAAATDCDGGGRMVFRHNTMRNAWFMMHDSIIVGTRGCRKWEVYENSWVTTSSELATSGQFAQIEVRGGTGVVFNNTFAASSGADIYYSNYRAGGETSGAPWSQTCQNSGTSRACLGSRTSNPTTCTSDANCGGVTGSCVKIDGSGGSGLPTNYPCRDQMGTGDGNPQTIKPALFWNNKAGSAQVVLDAGEHNDRTYLVEGRDFCVGSTQPSTCGGQAVNYVPYAYPHPLAVSGPRPKPPTLQQ